VTADRVFLDTSAVFEAADRSTRRYRETAAALETLLRSGSDLATTDLVVAELHGLTLGRLGPAVALSVVTALTSSGRVELVATGPDLVLDAIEIIRTRPGRRISVVDAASFLVMRNRGIETCFTIDSDFAAEGFAIVP
jgi:predicted nucleic acid-binding protein